MNNMTASGIKLIKHFEELHDGNLKKIGLQPKLCPAGVWTVGWGHACYDEANKRFLKGPADEARALELWPAMTVAEAEELLAADLQRFCAIVDNLLEGRQVGEERFSALVSLCFNIGQGNFKKSEVLRYTKLFQWTAAAEMFAQWRRADGKVLRGLVLRRSVEANLFLTGQLVLSNK